MGKSSGSSTPTTQNVVQSSLPPELLPYAQDILNQGENLSNQPYVNYAGQRQADVAGATQQAYNQAGSLGSVGSGAINQAGQSLADASQAAQTVQGAGQAQIQSNQTYDPTQYSAGQYSTPTYQASQYSTPTYQATQSTYDPTTGAPSVQAQQYNYNSVNTPQVNGVGNVGSAQWTQPGTAQQYMSPYLSSVLGQQMNLANTQFGEQQVARDASAVSQGAFGGDRAGLVDESAQRDFNNSQNLMVSNALNSAYTTGQQAFASNNAQNIQAQTANQNAGLTTQGANLNAALSTNNLNQQGQLQTQALNSGNINTANALNSSNLNANNALNAQYSFNTDQLNANQNLATNQLNAADINANNSLNSTNQLSTNQLNSNNINANNSLNSQNQLATNQLNSGNINTANALNSSNLNAQNQLNSSNYNTNIANLLQSGSLQNQTAAAQGQLGQTQQNMASTGLNALYSAGQAQQNYQQQGLDVGYNNFINQQQYPDQQLNFLSGLMHGFNVSPNSYTTTASSFSNPVTQLVGAGTGIAGIASALGNGG